MQKATVLIACWIGLGIALRLWLSPPWIERLPVVEAPKFDADAIKRWVGQVVQSESFDPTAPFGGAAEDRIDSLKELSVQGLIFETFDPTALMVVGVGPDGKPGVAGKDDGANGIVDDRGEIGASPSDDPFTILRAEAASTLDPAQFRILARGAFMPTRKKEIPERVTVLGDSYEFMIEAW